MITETKVTPLGDTVLPERPVGTETMNEVFGSKLFQIAQLRGAVPDDVARAYFVFHRVNQGVERCRINQAFLHQE